jgi:hypothetical protein
MPPKLQQPQRFAQDPTELLARLEAIEARLKNLEEAARRGLHHQDNLQILTRRENRQKGNKI